MSSKILYINPLGEKIFFAIYDNQNRQEKFLEIPFFTFAEDFPKILIDTYKGTGFQEIWLINGPGPFTKMRIITLAVNALKFSRPEIILKSRHFFDTFDAHETPILEANAKEFLTKINNEILFFEKNLLPKELHYIGFITNPGEDIFFTEYINNFDKLRHLFDKTSPENFVSPIYIKSPHITCPKNSTT